MWANYIKYTFHNTDFILYIFNFAYYIIHNVIGIFRINKHLINGTVIIVNHKVNFFTETIQYCHLIKNEYVWQIM